MMHVEKSMLWVFLHLHIFFYMVHFFSIRKFPRQQPTPSFLTKQSKTRKKTFWTASAYNKVSWWLKFFWYRISVISLRHIINLKYNKLFECTQKTKKNFNNFHILCKLCMHFFLFKILKWLYEFSVYKRNIFICSLSIVVKFSVCNCFSFIAAIINVCIWSKLSVCMDGHILVQQTILCYISSLL